MQTPVRNRTKLQIGKFLDKYVWKKENKSNIWSAFLDTMFEKSIVIDDLSE